MRALEVRRRALSIACAGGRGVGAARVLRMCGCCIEQIVFMLHTVALCSELTGSSNSRPKMSVVRRELMPRSSSALCSALISVSICSIVSPMVKEVTCRRLLDCRKMSEGDSDASSAEERKTLRICSKLGILFGSYFWRLCEAQPH